MMEPVSIVTDRELALMRALEVVFPRTAHILCLWHISANVLKNCKSHFESGDAWKDFEQEWTALYHK